MGITRGNNINMPCETEMRRAAAIAGEKVGDVFAARIFKIQLVTGKAGFLQRRPQHIPRRLRPDHRAHQLIHHEKVARRRSELPVGQRVRLEQRRVPRETEELGPLGGIRLSRHGYDNLGVLGKLATQRHRIPQRLLRRGRLHRIVLVRHGTRSDVAVQRGE